MSRPTPLIPPPRSQLELGEGRVLRVTAQLGRGSASTVYRATLAGGLGVARQVAVKVFDALDAEEHEEALATLTLAARRWAWVAHPNVVRLEDLGVIGKGRPYAVVELVEGRTLARLLAFLARRRERLPLDVALFIALEVSEGLAGARLGCSDDGLRTAVIHGDLAPGEVLLSWNGEVKVTDFGLGTVMRTASECRSGRLLVRKIATLAPEVAHGERADARSDVFSLGVLLHELLVGPRFPVLTTRQDALAWARDGRVHQGLFEPQPPPLLRSVLVRALERDPARRYPHAGAAVYDLRRAALSMGAMDGRGFLRSLLARTFGDEGAEDEAERTGEVLPARRSGFVDRFARLRGDVERAAAEGVPLESGTLPVAGTGDDEQDDDERAGGA